MPLDFSYGTKNIVLGILFCRFNGESSAFLRNNGMKGQDEAVFVVLKDSKFIIINLE